MNPPAIEPAVAPEKKKDVEAVRTDWSPSHTTPARVAPRDARESLIAEQLTIEGKIEGAGSIRLAGRFKGDVHVDGNLTVDAGARLTGGVRAQTVVIGGEVEGNINEANRVELLESGVLTGDLKAGSLTVAAGSRMRGQVEFGWENAPAAKSGAKKAETGSAS